MESRVMLSTGRFARLSLEAKQEPFRYFLKMCSLTKARWASLCSLSILQLQDLSSTHDAEDIKNLEQVYDKVEDIDLFAGMFTERTEFSDALYGATFLCLINDQFTRLKLGDRYFYDLNNEINPGAFELEQG